MVDAGVLVRSAREGARMSARDLAAKSGVSTSTVTRIERGEINPTVTMLERLLDASGNELVVTVHPRPDRPTLAALRERRDEILDIVASSGGSNVRVFGSVARGDSSVDSDVDVLIDVPPGTGLITIEQIADALDEILPWRVDVMTSGAARRRMAHVLDEAILL
ncbi:MAG TPA: helix-turn-helix domain-containing protein [Ilumatobacteraceae bacterium]